MPFKPGDPRPEGAGRKIGRPKGALSFRTRMLRDLMEREGYDPAEALLQIAKDLKLPLPIRMTAMQALLPFSYPKLAASQVEIRSLQSSVDFTKALRSLSTSEQMALEAVALRMAQLPSPKGATIDLTRDEQDW